MSNKPASGTNKFYVSLSITELQALGTVSGEAMRVYVAIASFCFGTTVTTYAKHEAMAKKMGKTQGVDKRRLNRLIKQLKDAGLIETYWGYEGEYSYLHYRLPLKAEVIKRRKQEEERQGKENREQEKEAGSKIQSSGVKKNSKAGSKKPHNNNKSNNTNKHLSNNNEIINNSFSDSNTDKTPKVKLTNGTYRSIGQLTNTFLENAWFITFHSKEDQKIIMKFLDENGYGTVTRQLEKIIKQEQEE